MNQKSNGKDINDNIGNTIDNWPSILTDGLPFVREGMSVEEFEKEKEYFGEHYAEYLNGAYEPLWKQNN